MEGINWNTVYFYLFAMVTCGFALGVLISSNIVRMAFYLILSLGATAALFFLAGADFVGAMQLMIYVGGTLVLLIFGVMLTAKGPFVSMKTGGNDWVLAVIVGGAMFAVLAQTLIGVADWWQADATADAQQPSYTATRIGWKLLGGPIEKLLPGTDVKRDPPAYLLPFEIVSVHLVVVLIGAAYLARTKRRAPG